MHIVRLAAIAATLSGSALSAASLTFDPSVACGLAACTNGAAIDQTYGDSPFVDVTYTARSAIGNSPALTASASYWSSGYGDLTGVAYADPSVGSVIEIRFAALNGATLRLNSIQFAGYRQDDATAIHLFDMNYNELFSYDASAPGTGHQMGVFFGFDVTNGFILQVGPDGYNTGIDNIDFGLATRSVPEPATWTLLLIGFGLIGAQIRRFGSVRALR